MSCHGAWAQKESAKLQNMRACTDKTGLSSIKLVSDSSKKLDDRQIKRFRCRQSRFLFPDLSRKIEGDSVRRVVPDVLTEFCTESLVWVSERRLTVRVSEKSSQ